MTKLEELRYPISQETGGERNPILTNNIERYSSSHDGRSKVKSWGTITKKAVARILIPKAFIQTLVNNTMLARVKVNIVSRVELMNLKVTNLRWMTLTTNCHSHLVVWEFNKLRSVSLASKAHNDIAKFSLNLMNNHHFHPKSNKEEGTEVIVLNQLIHISLNSIERDWWAWAQLRVNHLVKDHKLKGNNLVSLRKKPKFRIIWNQVMTRCI